MRADITSAAQIVCAPTNARTPAFGKTRDVGTPEIESAIVTLCQGPNEAAFVSIHEGLAQSQPLVALAHKNHMLLDAPKVDFSQPKALDSVDKAAMGACKKSWPGLGRALLTSAETMPKERAADALGRCLDVIAMARDADLVGDALDSLLANSDLQLVVVHCSAIAEQAPKDVAATFAASVLTLKGMFPPNLDDVFKRDIAETTVFNFGPARDPAQTLPCQSATELSKGMGDLPEAKADQRKLLDGWKQWKEQPPPDTSKYREAYELSLRTLDKLAERATRDR